MCHLQSSTEVCPKSIVLKKNHESFLLREECRFADISDKEMGRLGDVARSNWPVS